MLKNHLPLFLFIAGVLSGCMGIRQEHNEAASIPIEFFSFETVPDGVYEGSYNGGMYRWRENQVKVTVCSGKIAEICLLHSKELNEGDSIFIHLVKRVLELQSLDIDALSGATLTTKAHLKAIENALLSAIKAKKKE